MGYDNNNIKSVNYFKKCNLPVFILLIILIFNNNVFSQANNVRFLIDKSLSLMSNKIAGFTNEAESPQTNGELVLTNEAVSVLSNEEQGLTNVDTSVSNETPALTNSYLTPPVIKTNEEIVKEEPIPITPAERNNHQIVVMGEFGLGNIIGLYGAYRFNLPLLDKIYIGIGGSYLYYGDENNETSINVFEPSVVIVKEIDMMIFRIRTGIDFISEDRFGFTGTAIRISPDVMVKYKGVYAGISLPVIIGDEGTGVAFAVGAGYKYLFEF